jgi:hypothetical protein
MKSRAVSLTIKVNPKYSNSPEYPLEKIVVDDVNLNDSLGKEGIVDADFEDILSQVEDSIRDEDYESKPEPIHKSDEDTAHKFTCWAKVGVAGTSKVEFLLGLTFREVGTEKTLVIVRIAKVK